MARARSAATSSRDAIGASGRWSSTHDITPRLALLGSVGRFWTPAAAVLLYGNIHVPFGPEVFRQALKFQIEQRVQRRNHITTVGLSHIF